MRLLKQLILPYRPISIKKKKRYTLLYCELFPPNPERCTLFWAPHFYKMLTHWSYPEDSNKNNKGSTNYVIWWISALTMTGNVKVQQDLRSFIQIFDRFQNIRMNCTELQMSKLKLQVIGRQISVKFPSK